MSVSKILSCIDRDTWVNTHQTVNIEDWEYGTKNLGELMALGLTVPKYEVSVNGNSFIPMNGWNNIIGGRTLFNNITADIIGLQN